MDVLVQKQALQGIWAGDQVLSIGLGSQGRYDWGWPKGTWVPGTGLGQS